MTGPASTNELAQLEATVDRWLQEQLSENPVVAAVDREDGDRRRWFVRVLGEEKDTFSVWFTLDQRTLSYETYVMPAPEENEQQFYEHLLRRNLKFFGASFAIGAEDAVFLVGQLPVEFLTDDQLDRVLGSLYHYVELTFRPLLRIGFPTCLAAANPKPQP